MVPGNLGCSEIVVYDGSGKALFEENRQATKMMDSMRLDFGDARTKMLL